MPKLKSIQLSEDAPADLQEYVQDLREVEYADPSDKDTPVFVHSLTYLIEHLQWRFPAYKVKVSFSVVKSASCACAASSRRNFAASTNEED